VLVTEKAKQQNIPYAIVTSGHGTHGDITTPVAVLLKEKGLIQSVRGNVAGEQRPGTGRTMAKYVRNGQFLSLDEFTAARTAEGNEQDIQEMTQDYEARKTRFDASLRQPLFTDREKNNQFVWDDVIKWMECVVKKGGGRSSTAVPQAPTSPQK
jgi:hypothetical protein